MNYECELTDGTHLTLQNVAGRTSVLLQSARGASSQCVDFTTGAWSGKPRAREGALGCVVRLETANGPKFLHLAGNALSAVELAPALDSAREIPLRETESGLAASVIPTNAPVMA